MKLYQSIIMLLSLGLLSCQGENQLLKQGDMLFLRHKGASMPVLVRGNPQADAILLVIHGGAGGSASAHIEDFKNFVEPEHLVAYWDQRQAGNSQGKFAKEDLTIDLMAEDMQMVIRMLRKKYGQDKKIFAFGHSWGVILGTYYLISQPNELDGAVFANGAHSSEHEYSARLDYVRNFAQERIDQGEQFAGSIQVNDLTFENLPEIVSWCEANDPIENWDQLSILNALVFAVKPYVNRTYLQTPDIPSGISSQELNFQSPYNPFTANQNQLRSGQVLNNFSAQTSIQEFYDFTPLMQNISLPVALYFGRYDDIIGPEVAEDYFEVIGTPEEDKELLIFDHSGHSPQFRENILFNQKVLEFIAAH
ncbi:MAG: alpha/beta hydrolase [Bacteroidota bacterium]